MRDVHLKAARDALDALLRGGATCAAARAGALAAAVGSEAGLQRALPPRARAALGELALRALAAVGDEDAADDDGADAVHLQAALLAFARCCLVAAPGGGGGSGGDDDGGGDIDASGDLVTPPQLAARLSAESLDIVAAAEEGLAARGAASASTTSSQECSIHSKSTCTAPSPKNPPSSYSTTFTISGLRYRT